jgi:hypothetical protein
MGGGGHRTAWRAPRRSTAGPVTTLLPVRAVDAGFRQRTTPDGPAGGREADLDDLRARLTAELAEAREGARAAGSGGEAVRRAFARAAARVAAERADAGG